MDEREAEVEAEEGHGGGRGKGDMNLERKMTLWVEETEKVEEMDVG